MVTRQALGVPPEWVGLRVLLALREPPELQAFLVYRWRVTYASARFFQPAVQD